MKPLTPLPGSPCLPGGYRESPPPTSATSNLLFVGMVVGRCSERPSVAHSRHGTRQHLADGGHAWKQPPARMGAFFPRGCPLQVNVHTCPCAKATH